MDFFKRPLHLQVLFLSHFSLLMKNLAMIIKSFNGPKLQTMFQLFVLYPTVLTTQVCNLGEECFPTSMDWLPSSGGAGAKKVQSDLFAVGSADGTDFALFKILPSRSAS